MGPALRVFYRQALRRARCPQRAGSAPSACQSAVAHVQQKEKTILGPVRIQQPQLHILKVVVPVGGQVKMQGPVPFLAAALEGRQGQLLAILVHAVKLEVVQQHVPGVPVDFQLHLEDAVLIGRAQQAHPASLPGIPVQPFLGHRRFLGGGGNRVDGIIRAAGLTAGDNGADQGQDDQPRHQHPHQAHLTGRAAEVIQLFPDLAGLVLEADLLLVGIFTPYYGVGIRCMA